MTTTRFADKRLIALCVALIFLPLLWLALASYVWCIGARKPYDPLAWWYGTQWFGANWWSTAWLTAGATLPSMFALIALAGAFQWWRLRGRVQPRLVVPRQITAAPRVGRRAQVQPIIRGITDNHGHSEWRSIEDTKKRFPGSQPPYGGIVVGEAYRVDHDYAVAGIEFDPSDKSTWGLGGKTPLLIDPCTHGARAWHSAIFAPTGSGKSATLVTQALVWTGASVIFDPTVELGPLLDRAMRRARKRVFHVGLPDPTKHIHMTGFNVLSAIDVTHPEAEAHLRSIVGRIYDQRSADTANRAAGNADDRFFGAMGRALITCLLADLVWSDPDKVEISLATFATGMATPEDDMVRLLHKIHANSPSPMARRLAGTFMQARAAETFSGIYMNAVKGVEWLFTWAYADMLSIGDFDPRALLLGNCTTFLNIDLRTLEVAPLIPRVLIGALLDTMIMADGHVHSPVAFFIDEADTLGRLNVLATARDRGRHYKIILHMLWQSLFQLRHTWGEDEMRAWLDAFSWVGYAGIRASGAGKELQADVGGHGVLAFSEGNNQGQQQPFGLSFGTFSRGQNVNVHEISHHLMTAPQLQQDLRADELIVIPDSGMPMRIGRAYWFRRSKIVEHLAA